ncbi:uncharacterized protein FIESC28_11331 [Fusarium coffeatum]|uniref:Uncharacterized protein n=1 Tax=Fusarium coffeatum TaxID=231269 RepID=A0A366QNP8_9HYPO|nr:uncharacterized protein FIESC28_11331 [Fusarium coffeatum]RBR05520.1 hypothetical protein FIESC28_11331 [Fusarium coffeatum]
MAGEIDFDHLLSLANRPGFDQWIDESFHESTSEFDLTNMDLLDTFINPEEHLDRLSTPSEFLEENDFSPTVTLSESGNMEERGSSATLTPATRSARVDSAERVLKEYQQDGQTPQHAQRVQNQQQNYHQSQPQIQAGQQLPIHDHIQTQFPAQVTDSNQALFQSLPGYQVPAQAQAQYLKPENQPQGFYQPFPQQSFFQVPYVQGLLSPQQKPFMQAISPPQPNQPQPGFNFTTPVNRPIPSNRQPVLNRPVPGPPTEQAPKKYRLAHPTSQNKYQAWLVPKLEQFTRQYQGYIPCREGAHRLEAVFLSLATPPDAAVKTRIASDPTFPRSPQDDCARVREMFEAICDWSSPREWRAKMGPAMAKKWTDEFVTDRKAKGLSEDISKLTEKQLAPPPERMPPIYDQWKNVIHQQLSDIEIELLCAKILNEAIRAQEGKNFVPLWSGQESQWEEFDSFGQR